MHPVTHFEIPADNVDRARKFYSEAFGWTMTPWGEEYTMIGTTQVGQDQVPTRPGAINGGLARRNPAVRTPVVVVSVPDIQAGLRAVEKAGGSIVEKPIPVGDMGTVAYAKDTEGNVVGLWQDAKK